MILDYKPGDRRGYSIYSFAKKPKGGWTEETCNNFIEYIIKQFESVYGFKPNTIDVPDDYTGKEIWPDAAIRRKAKPTGHYYAYQT
jgi:hypothetical protein